MHDLKESSPKVLISSKEESSNTIYNLISFITCNKIRIIIVRPKCKYVYLKIIKFYLKLGLKKKSKKQLKTVLI